MFEWLNEQYLTLITNYQILMSNPTRCGTVDLLKIFSFTLFFVLLIKTSIHLVVFNLLKHNFTQYTEISHPKLYKIYKHAACKFQIGKIPSLYQFSRVRPLIFTIGTFKPAIFMSHYLVDKLSAEELEIALVHELTHIKRRDNALIWFMELIFAAIPLLIIQVFALSFTFSIENSVYAILGALTFILVFKLVLWKRILFLRELSCDDVSIEVTKAPLTLAASLIKVWKLGHKLPRYSWHSGLGFVQAFLPTWMNFEFRVKRLLDYHKPRLKFLLGKTFKFAAVLVSVFIIVFLLQFYSLGGNQFGDDLQAGVIPVLGSVISCSVSDNYLELPNKVVQEARFQKIISIYSRAIRNRDADKLQKVLSETIVDKYSMSSALLIDQYLNIKYGRLIEIKIAEIINEDQAIIEIQFEQQTLNLRIILNEDDKINAVGYISVTTKKNTQIEG